MLDTHIKVRVNTTARVEFVMACHRNGMAATEVLREAMDDYIRTHRTPVAVTKPDKIREVCNG